MKKTLILRTTFTLFIFSSIFYSVFAQVNYTVNVTQVRWYEGGIGGDCWESGTEEYSALVWARDNTSTTYQGGNCFTCENNGNCTVNTNTLIASGTNTCADQIILRFSGWEDDNGDRCTLDGGDDCGCGPSDVATINFRNAGTGCTTYGSYGCQNDHDVTVQICWDYTNNSICNRALSILDGTTAFSTVGVCPEGNQSSCAGAGDVNALWYAYTATATGTTVFETCASGYDTSLSIFSDCNNMELACNDDNATACGSGSIQSSISLNTTCNTTYYIRVAGFNGATGSGVLTITPPIPIADPGPDSELCLGETYILGGSPAASGSTGPYTYNWSPNIYLSSTTVANPTFTGSTLGTFVYTLEVTDVCGNLSASELVTVSVVEESINATSGYELCKDQTVPSGEGMEVVCSGTCSAGNGVPSWYDVPSGGTVLSNNTIFDPVGAGHVNSSIAGTYTFYVECACNGCVTPRVPVDFVVLDNPDLVLNPTAESCLGNNDGSISALISGGTPPYSIQWNISSNATTISNLVPGNYTTTVTDSKGCSVTNTTTVDNGLDITIPSCMVQNITVPLDANGMATITVEDVDNGTSDNCGTPSLSLDITSFDCTNVGPNTVTLTAIDGEGNTSSCSATVTIEDAVSACSTCDDGILNGQETGIDCGGPTCPACPTCTVSQYYFGVLSSGIYQASNTIGTNASIPSTEDVSLLAETICLDPDFEVSLGAEFLADATPCIPMSSTPPPASVQADATSTLETLSDGTLLLSYDLNTNTVVHVRIEKIDGTYQQHFFSEEKLVGAHQVQIQPVNLPRGVYAIIFQTEKGKQTKRFVIP